jgi:hypothetical protein
MWDERKRKVPFMKVDAALQDSCLFAVLLALKVLIWQI